MKKRVHEKGGAKFYPNFLQFGVKFHRKISSLAWNLSEKFHFLPLSTHFACIFVRFVLYYQKVLKIQEQASVEDLGNQSGNYYQGALYILQRKAGDCELILKTRMFCSTAYGFC